MLEMRAVGWRRPRWSAAPRGLVNYLTTERYDQDLGGGGVVEIFRNAERGKKARATLRGIDIIVGRTDK
jgi:hypothetical protein